MYDPPMEDASAETLSCGAKLALVVLANCGPLSPSEIADEAYVTAEQALDGLVELDRLGLAEPVCGVCEEREEVYALTDAGEAVDAGA